MSSICAVWSDASEPGAGVLLDQMLDAQAAYGPHRRFAWSEKGVGLGGNLMHLLPEDVHDRQPLWTADGSACMVADVRLDDRADLERELGLTGSSELADSAVLLAAWERWGEGLLDRVIGAFGFAVWMPGRRELFAARDHVGERPLFFTRSAGLFAVATMPKGLLALPGVYQGFNESRMVDHLIIDHPDWTKSFFKGLEKVPLGHWVRARPGSVECRRYWSPLKAKETRFKRDEEYAEGLVEVLDRATAARLRSPRGIGTQLSAGLDSSSVAASAARLLAREGRRLTAFTSVPRKEGFLGLGIRGRLVYEGEGAAEVAALYPNMDHVLIDSEGGDLLADMEAWTDAMDEPAQNGVNLLWISAILNAGRERGLGVMLQGVYGNATISADGWEAQTAYFRKGRWLELYRLATAARQRGERSYKASFVTATNGLLPMWLRKRIKPGATSVSLDYTAINPALTEKFGLLERTFRRMHADLPDVATMRERFFQRFDAATLNTAMRARSGMDIRDPTGDKRVFEYCFSIPVEQYVVGRESRSLVRRAMKGRLPEATLRRSIRGQQGADWYLTVEEALPAMREEMQRIAQSKLAQHYLDIPRLERLLAAWPEVKPGSGHEGDEITDEWNYALTRGVTIGYFLRTWEERQGGSEMA